MKHPIFCKIFDIDDTINLITTPKHSLILERFLFLTNINYSKIIEEYQPTVIYKCNIHSKKSYNRLISQMVKWDVRYDITREEWQHKLVTYLRKIEEKTIT